MQTLNEFLEQYRKNSNLTCKNCARVLPNDNYFTKHGCIWCTTEKSKEKK